MKRILTLAFVGTLAAIVAGCSGGNGGDPQSYFGGAARELGNKCQYGAGVITSRHDSRSAAQTAAFRRCESEVTRLAAGAARDTCKATSFTQCAAIAVGYSSATGKCRLTTRSASTLSGAQSSALQGCQTGLGAGADCEVMVAACSGSAGSPHVGYWSTPRRVGGEDGNDGGNGGDPGNRPPVAASTQSYSGNVGAAWTWTRQQLEGSFSDPDGDTLTYRATSNSASVASVSISSSGLRIDARAAGSATISVTATDPGGLSATWRIQVTVGQSSSGNRPPVAASTQSYSGNVGAAWTWTRQQLEGSFSDPDGDTLTYRATSNSASVASVSISSSGLRIDARAAGSATISVTATDPGGLSATWRIQVTVGQSSSGNRPPVAASTQSYSGNVGAAWTWTRQQLEGSFSDPDGDTLTYRATSNSASVASVSISSSGLRIDARAAGSATISVTATDPGGLSATWRIQVTVNRPSTPPPPPSYYGAISTDIENTTCRLRPGGIITNSRSQPEARRDAINLCVSDGGTRRGCSSHVTEFGSAYRRNIECGALAYGDLSSDGCGYETGIGGTISAAEQNALSNCRSRYSNCRLVPPETGVRFANCTD